MKRAFLTTVFLMTFCKPLFGQHGSAPNGYYPPGYSGDTWTGEVVSTDDTTREITLTYTNGKKSETFTGVLQNSFQAIGHELGICALSFRGPLGRVEFPRSGLATHPVWRKP